MRRQIMTRRIVLPAIVAGALLVSWSGLTAEEEAGGLKARQPGTVSIEGNPDGIGQYVVVEAFPDLRFERPLWIGCPPDGSNRVFVAEQGGVVKAFPNRRAAKKARVVLDWSRNVFRGHNEEGLLGMAFHPHFKKNRRVYLYYSSGNPRRSVLSEFRMNSSRTRVDTRSERVVLRQRQPRGNNNGGGLAFGLDGYLYVSIGDGGAEGDPRGHGQNLDNWLGSILRVDVSARRGFNVPPDNPFVGVPHTRPEVWAYGLRNVRRFSFDPVTGFLWAGDSGPGRVEEINLIVKGGNYGWNLREGLNTFKPGRALRPLIDPVIEIPHAEGRSITGGVVYRGKRLPGLVGAYIYADRETGNVWALRAEGSRVVENKLIGRGKGISSITRDVEGELLMTAFDGKVYTLAPWRGDETEQRFPQRLSDTGLFTDLRNLTPHPALVPYSLNAPLWSDGARKQRYIMLPDMQKIRVGKDGRYEFPEGTILVKTFWLGPKERTVLTGIRLETRLLVKSPSGWAGYTYVWNDEQEDAFLIHGRVEQDLPAGMAGAGGTRRWTFPSRTDCMSCHTAAAGYVLGFRTEQINRLHDYDGVKENQIDALNRIGYFDGAVSSNDPAMTDWSDPEADNTGAVRAYLDANCAMCHQPTGPGNANIDLRWDTPLEKTNVLDKPPGMWDLGILGARLLAPGKPERSLLYVRMKRTDEKGMPNLAHNLPDAEALARIAAWIREMKTK